MNYPGAKGEGSQPRFSLPGKQRSKTKHCDAPLTTRRLTLGCTKLLPGGGGQRGIGNEVAVPLPYKPATQEELPGKSEPSFVHIPRENPQ